MDGLIAIILALVVVTCIVLVLPILLVIRIFARLARQERAVQALWDRIDVLASEMARTRAPLPPKGGSHEEEAVHLPRKGGSHEEEAVHLPREGGSHAERAVHLPPEGGSHAESAVPLPTEGASQEEWGGHLPLPPQGGSHEDPGATAAGGFRLQAEAHHAPESLETTIGTQWLLYAGVAAIVIGIAYFEKLAIEKQWIGETARVIQGAIVGLALVYIGTRFVRRGYALYGQMMSGCGAAILYVSTYAAFNYYHLIDRPLAFVLMIGITAMTAGLADRQQSQGLAVLAVGSGFATPFLLPGTTDAQVALFGYDAILIAGTMFLAARRDWPLLNIVSYIFTLVTVAAWADHFYTPAKYLRTELFMTLFCGMFLYILRQCRRSNSEGAQMAALFLWSAPLAYYFASLIVLGHHESALLIWLVAVMLAGGIGSVPFGLAVGLGAWIGATVPLLLWSVQHTGADWVAPGLATVAGIYAIALAAQMRGMTDDVAVRPVRVVWLHLNGLLMFAAAYFLIEPVRLAATGPAAAAFAVWNGAIAAAVLSRHRDYALHFAALAFTLLSIAIALQFDGPAVTIGWAAEGTAIIALGLRERRSWMRLGGVVLFAIAISRTIDTLTSVAPINQAILLNPRAASAAFVIAASYLLAWLHQRDAEAPDRAVAIAASLIVAQFVGVFLLTSEINACWRERNDHFAQEAMISVTWAVYATVLIVIGLRRHYAPIRYFAMALFALTTAKVFFIDLAELQRIYRVISVIGLGILLLLTSWLYQRSKNETPLDAGIDDLKGRI